MQILTIVRDLLAPFLDAGVSINHFSFRGKAPKEFWDFLKAQNRKGIYVFFDVTECEFEQILYVGKAGSFEDGAMTVYKRTSAYFFPRRAKDKITNQVKYPMSPLNKDGDFEFRKFNSSSKQADRVFAKSSFAMTAVLIDGDASISPELLESFMLTKLWKNHGHYPRFNNKI